MKYPLLIGALLMLSSVQSNDGAFYMNGNQLIPIRETQVSLSKEILTVKRVGRTIYIDVDYTFYNPGIAKDVLMGFEAPMPLGAAQFIYSGKQITRNHPFLKNFIVEINGQRISYKADIVNKKAFNTIGSLAGFPQVNIDSMNTEAYEYRGRGKFLYECVFVNYFTAHFKPGVNKVHHTYSFPQSGTNDVPLNFEYILTAANRWANGQIDDFTLIVDMGDFKEFYINQTFFKGLGNWNDAAVMHLGNPKKADEENEGYHIGRGDDRGSIYVRTRQNPLVYHENNFRPQGELIIWNNQNFYEYIDLYGDSVVFDVNEYSIMYEFYVFYDRLQFVKDEFSLKVLRNYPFALRGYAFKNKAIRRYYERMGWYDPDADYEANTKDLSKKEWDWLSSLKIQSPVD